MFLQFVVLCADLLDEFAAYCAHSADEEVENFIFGEEEGVVQYVQRFLQIGSFDDERDVGFGGSLRKGYHADAASAERAEQFSRDARHVAHVLSDDGHGGEVLLYLHREHGAGFDFVAELLVEHSCCLVGIFFAHADGGGVFGRGLCYEEG